MRRTTLRPSAEAHRSFSKRSARTHAANLLSKLKVLYPEGEWALLTEVRSSTGCPEVLRYADALAVRLWGESWEIEGFELKTSRGDWLRELRDPEKSGPLKLFCRSWWLVVPAPWSLVVLSLHELPELWGLLEVGTGVPVVVRYAAERRAEDPGSHPGFLKSLFRSAQAPQSEAVELDAPLVPVTRPALSHGNTGLACGHSVPRPLSKTFPSRLPCFACAGGFPADAELVEAAIDDAAPEDRDRFAARLRIAA